MTPDYFLQKLYPLQDDVLHIITRAKVGLYLTGGTALSRGYLFHRFSDDLDLFTNLNSNFAEWCQKIISDLREVKAWQVEIQRFQSHFVRFFVTREDVILKVECVNDVPSHIGEITDHPTLGRLDSPENIIANKVTALLNREEPKDLADVWGLHYKLGLSLKKALTDADSKAVGIFPAYLAKRLFNITYKDWEAVRWITPPDPDQYIRELKTLAESLILVE